MKKKFLIIVIITIIFLFLISLSIYKFVIIKNKEKKLIFKTVKISTKIVDTSDTVSDTSLYGENVINENITSYDYELIVGDNGIRGKVYIGENKKIYITNEKNNTFYNISDKKFKTLYRKEADNNLLTLYAISEDGNLYYIYLSSLDIKKAGISDISLPFSVKNFTNLNFKSIKDIVLSNVVVLSEDGNIYEARTGIRYNPEIISLFEKYYIKEDKTILNRYGYILKNDNNEYFKIKYYIELPIENSTFPDATDIIITKDYRIIYIDNKNEFELKIYNKKIENLDYITKNNQKVELEILFEDKSYVTVNGYYTEYYGL